GPQVGAFGERVEAAEALEIGLLHQVLCVGAIAGHAQRAGEELGRVLHRFGGEVRLIGHARTVPLGAPARSVSGRQASASPEPVASGRLGTTLSSEAMNLSSRSANWARSSGSNSLRMCIMAVERRMATSLCRRRPSSVM